MDDATALEHTDRGVTQIWQLDARRPVARRAGARRPPRRRLRGRRPAGRRR